MKKLILAASLAVLAAWPAAADETVKVLHIRADPGEQAVMAAAAADYEAAHPGVKIELQYLENEAFKAKLPTLLQAGDSEDIPDAFWGWGAGGLTEQVKSGVVRSIDTALDDATKATYSAGALGAFTRDGQLYGIPINITEVVLWYNKKLFAQAGVDAESMKTWSGFLAGVQKLKDAGITPISVGAKDKWPVHFFWSYLVMREVGHDGFTAARNGENGGFAGEGFVKASQSFLDLVKLNPFQEGFQAAGYTDAAGLFGDGKAAMHLMGDWDYAAAKTNSASKQGIPDEDLGMLPFPTLEGGAGDPNDTLGGMDGWAFSKNASDEAVKFIAYYQSAEVQAKIAAGGYYIPAVIGGADALSNPFQKEVAANIAKANWHAIFFDQELGADVGGVVNDTSAQLASDVISAQDAALQIEAAMASTR